MARRSLLAALLVAACKSTDPTPVDGKTEAKTPDKAAIEISSIHWESSNPSLGPHEVSSSASVSASAFDSPQAWRVAVDVLLDDTKVNGVATLREYLVAMRDKNILLLGKVDAASKSDGSTGGGFASLSFSIAGGETLRIRSLQSTRLQGHWDSFWDKHLRGRISQDSPELPPSVDPDAPVAPVAAPQGTWPRFDCTEGEDDDAGPDTEGEMAWLLRDDDDDHEPDAGEGPKRPRRGVGALAWSTGVAVDGELFVDGVQCSAFPGWAVTDPSHADDPSEVIKSGEKVRVIDASGVRQANVTVDAAANEATIPSATASTPTIASSKAFELVVRRAKPSAKAKLIDRRLEPPKATGVVAKRWIEDQEKVDYKAAGTVFGRFGGGVDALVVVAPSTIFPQDEDNPEPDFCTSEFVVALSKGKVSGVLPLTRDAGNDSRKACACDEDVQPSIQNVEVARSVDLDGDGTQEVVWVYQYLGGDLTTQISITYFADGKFENKRVASCTYNGCERFLGQDHCGRSLVKKYETK